jgi:hypothetical protein
MKTFNRVLQHLGVGTFIIGLSFTIAVYLSGGF